MRSRHPRQYYPLTAPIADSFGDVRAEDVGAAGKIGSIQEARDPGAALKAAAGALPWHLAYADYEENLRISRYFLAKEPGHVERPRDVSASLNNVGRIQQARDPRAALKAYEESLRIRCDLLAEELGNVRRLRDVSVSLDSVGSIQQTRDPGATWQFRPIGWPTLLFSRATMLGPGRPGKKRSRSQSS